MFQRRPKPVDPNAKAANNGFFGTVGSPIKMAKFNGADKNDGQKQRRPRRPRPANKEDEMATLDVNKKQELKEEIKKQKEQENKEEKEEKKEEKKEEVATMKGNNRGRGRRDSTEFLGAPMEPVQQLNLDGAKKAKIPRFMSAWFNAGKEEAKEVEAPAEAEQETNAADYTTAAETAPEEAVEEPPKEEPEEPKVEDDKNPLNGRANYSQSIDFSEIKLGRMIGEGAFGKVHEGKWRGKGVAVKLLICQDLRSDILNEFQSEVEIMSVLRHPNICRLLGACMEPPHRALVVELLQRGSLWGVLRVNRKSITQDMRSRFIYDTAKGMSYLHHFERPILHRDLKSPNLLVDKNFNIKLSDFGLARVKAHVQTMTGNCGTVQWMAPEVLGNQKYTEKADVFSFGIVVWEIMTGECPYDGMSQIQAALGVLNRNLRPNIPRDCPPFFSRLMKACWNRQPELRPSFPHIVNAFRTYQSSISESRATSAAAASAKAAMSASIKAQ